MAEPDPRQEDLLLLHESLLGNDPTAAATLAGLLLPALRRRFAGRRELEPAEIDSLIGLSIANYFASPDRYDSARAPLLAYLYRDVDGDVRNEAAKRRRRREEPLREETLEEGGTRGKSSVEDEVVDVLDPLDLPPPVVELARAELSRLSEEDREFLRLRAEGVRSTHVFAEVLGIAHLPVDQQRQEVKRAKDRLDKRLGSIRGRLNR